MLRQLVFIGQFKDMLYDIGKIYDTSNVVYTGSKIPCKMIIMAVRQTDGGWI